MINAEYSLLIEEQIEELIFNELIVANAYIYIPWCELISARIKILMRIKAYTLKKLS